MVWHRAGDKPLLEPILTPGKDGLIYQDYVYGMPSTLYTWLHYTMLRRNSFLQPMWPIYESANYESLVQIIAWRLFGAKLLYEAMLPYCQSDPWEQIAVQFESIYNFIPENWFKNIVYKIRHIVLATMY